MSKTIVITGAGAGLGKYLSRGLSADGHRLFLLGRTLSKLETVAEPLENATAIACDVTASASVNEAFAEIRKLAPTIDVLVNNAAITGPGGTVEQATDEYIHGIFDTHLAGAVYCIRAAVPMMEPGGLIINVSSDSVGSHFPHHVLYSTSKAGLEHLSERLQEEMTPKGIRVTVVRAGPMIGDMADIQGRTTNPDIDRAFHEACLEKGLDLRKLPLSRYDNTVDLFRTVINLPEDVHVPVLHFTGWAGSR